MNIKNRLEEELLFSEKLASTQTIKYLNNKGIYTIEEFINCNVDQTLSTSNSKEMYRAYQKILRYKYLREPLIVDVILERKYYDRFDGYGGRFDKDIRILGFNRSYWSYANSIIEKIGPCRLIDIFSFMISEYSIGTYLIKFYVDYYNNQVKKEKIEEKVIENDKDVLDSLKNELVFLLNKKNELDTEISLLLDKINTLEGGKINNARK